MSELKRIVPSLLVRDMAETLSFYRKLGFVVSGHNGNGASGWAEVHRGAVAIQFYTDPPHGTPTEPVCSGTFYVFSSDIDVLAEEFRGNVEFAWGLEVWIRHEGVCRAGSERILYRIHRTRINTALSI